MNCIYCGTPLSDIDYCTGCGADITILKRVARISNLLYNEGLDKARVRDLSGAIKSLKRSLEFNKENKDARNLLGLVYFESGEVVSALTEWVISKNMNPDDNLAEYYIDKLQSNKNKLDTINQTIRKYNQALVYCREDNDDMAVIQLKKVLSQNPKLIKAYHLLALLYLKRQEYEKARKLLKKAAFIDTNNTTTLRYLQEVELATGISTSLDMKRKKKEYLECAAFTVPSLFLVMLVFYIPFVMSLYYSLTEWNGISKLLSTFFLASSSGRPLSGFWQFRRPDRAFMKKRMCR